MEEDDFSFLQLSTSVLKSSGFQVDTAVDGAAGWDALHTSSYDLLITDNNMPKLSGVELVQKLRSAHMTLSVVMAPGTIPTEALNRNPSLDLAAMLAKPFTMDELLEPSKKRCTQQRGLQRRLLFFGEGKGRFMGKGCQEPYFHFGNYCEENHREQCRVDHSLSRFAESSFSSP